MEIKRTEFISPVITLPNGNTTIFGEIRTEINLKEFSDSEIENMYSLLKLKVEVMDNRPNLISKMTEYKLRTDFRKVKMEYECRFPTWKINL